MAHERLLALIEDEGEVRLDHRREVTLDLTLLVSDVAAGIGIGGDIASKLPEGAAHIEILQSDELGAAQKGVKLLRTLAWVLTALALLLYAAGDLSGARVAPRDAARGRDSRSSRSARST